MGSARVVKAELERFRRHVEQQARRDNSRAAPASGRRLLQGVSGGRGLGRLGPEFLKRRSTLPSRTGPTSPQNVGGGRTTTHAAGAVGRVRLTPLRGGRRLARPRRARIASTVRWLAS